MTSICIVDNNPVVAVQMRRAAEAAGFTNATAFVKPADALQYCMRNEIDAVLVDFSMPGMDGVSFIRELRAREPECKVVMALMSGHPLTRIKEEAYEAGAMDVLTKPVLGHELRQLSRAVYRRKFGGDELSNFKKNLTNRFVTCLENICDLNSYVPGKHTNRVAAYVLVIGRHLGLDPNWVQLLSDASRMYGIGKAMSCSSQSKLNLSLKSENYLSLHIDKDYSLAGYELLRDLPGDVFELAAEVALYHCENWDGSGAPIGASGVGIPLSARIVTVAVQFDKMTSLTDRDPAWLISRALLVIKADEGVQFDPSVVDSLLAAESEIRAIKKHFDGESAAQERIARPHLQKRKS